MKTPTLTADQKETVLGGNGGACQSAATRKEVWVVMVMNMNDGHKNISAVFAHEVPARDWADMGNRNHNDYLYHAECWPVSPATTPVGCPPSGGGR